MKYKVAQGDNLLTIAREVGSTIEALRNGNCYNPLRGIFAGETLRVPRLPTTKPATAVPIFADGSRVHSMSGCQSEALRIESPAALAELQGIFEIVGTANPPHLGHYRIAVRPAWAEEYSFYLEADEPVSAGVLGLVNTEIFGAGLHYLRLALVDERGEITAGALCEVPVIFAAP